MDSLVEFQHKKLQTPTSFRLILLLPGDFHEQLKCSVVNVELEEGDKLYEAVSYVWGSSQDKATILCNNAPFHITRNLEAFLRRFRDSSKSRVLWIDSICIDQSNLTELGHQVKLMGEIYRRAWTVVVWMGEEHSDSNFPAVSKGVELLYNLFERNEEILAWTDIGRGTEGPIRNYDRVQAQFGLPDVDGEEFKALAKFWRNPWFSRAWTFQESILATRKRFYYGQHILDGRTLAGAYWVSVMLNFATDAEIFFNEASADSTMTMFMMQGDDNDEVEPATDLLHLLYRRRGAHCQRPCDLVYALLGLITNNINFEPNYDRHFTYIFAEVTLDIIRHRQDLNIFNQAHPLRGISELPSWVPDWRLDSGAYKLTKSPFGFSNIHLYRCTGSSQPRCSMSADGRKLTMHGYEADRIYAVGSLFINKDIPYSLLRQLDFPLVDGKYMYTSEEELGAAVLRILCCDINYPERPKRGYGERWAQTTHEELVSIIQKHNDGSDPEGLAALHTRMRDQVMGCGWMITDGGRVGIAPRYAQAGDIITLMFGGRVPLLLRESGNEHTFVGECYVDQIMDGELFSKPHLLPTSQDFVLI